MAFSDDEEEEVVPGAVTEYHFVDDKEEPVCFSHLPLLWDEDEPLDDARKAQVFLHGKSDDGLQKIYKQVVAWKVEIGGDGPEVSVLTKEKRWLKLLKPWTAYKDTIRKILVTLECLVYLKRNPAASEKSLWEHVRKVFSHFEVGASEDDLMDHITFIQAVVKSDERLAKSQLLLKLLDDLPKGKVSNKKVQKSDFVNDSDDREADNNDGDESEDDVECFDTVCAICDNGGELLCCEGDCLRSFHATKDAGEDSDCKTLGYSRTQVNAIQNFFCPNCVHKKHQCFACGKLGNSNKESGAEVFRCISASCGHFYHPHCVAKLLHLDNEDEAAALEEKIPAGESFLCPVHKCMVCGQIEDKVEKELQFAMCRRCPKSYHRKCLPQEIHFDASDDEDVEQRAWDGLIPNRILIYCLRHEIDEEIGTPVRNHIKFPGTLERKVVHQKDSSKVNVLVKRKSEDLYRAKSSEKLNKAVERVPYSEEAALRKKLKTSDTSKGLSKDITKKGWSMEENKSLRDVRLSSSVLGSGSLKSVKKDAFGVKVKGNAPSFEGKPSPVSVIDSETKQRIMELVKRSPSSSLTVEDLLKKRRLPTTYAHCARQVGKTITQGKVQGSIEAIRAALQKFEKGCSIEDAKAVCGPDILNQILSWKKKFRVYLSPFLHGVRYSSYGRHFTKVDKLEEIVERLHLYVQNGDMIVDFCCGANDFSLLMKKKLDATGKKCLYKNYDLFQPKNDFNFERRDWLTVQPRELPEGSQLIMGLNPPFGVNAALANKFIDKALEFKPKLLILIVPKETERLDEKAAAYDLIWEDEEKLAGKAFYLPGSVDVNDNQIEQWNVKPPLLYLWSHPDWTTQHKAIASKHGHITKVCTEPCLEANKEPQTPVCQKEEHNYADTCIEVPSHLPLEQNGRAAGPIEKGLSPDVQAEGSRIENDVKRKDGHETAEHSDKGKSQAKSRKKSRKQKSKKQAEMSANGTVDNTSEMSISPAHETEPQCKFDGDATLDARADGTVDLGGSHRSTPGFGTTTYGGDWNGTLSREDVDILERKYVSREDIESLERKYATSSWKSPFSSSSLPNNVPSQLSYGVHHGSSEHFPAYIRDNPLPGFDLVPCASDERAIRTDVHTSLRMYGQQGLTDDQRGWHAWKNGASSVSADMGSFSLPFGLSSSAYGPSRFSVGSSAMQKYAPHLDELNYAGSGHSMPIPFRHPGDGGLFEMPGSRPPYGPGSQNLPPHHRASGGWLND